MNREQLKAACEGAAGDAMLALEEYGLRMPRTPGAWSAVQAALGEAIRSGLTCWVRMDGEQVVGDDLSGSQACHSAGLKSALAGE